MIGLLEPELQMQAIPRLSTGRWMQVLSHMQPKYGGISTVVPSLVHALNAQEVDTSVDAFCAPGEEFRPSGLDPNGIHFWPISRVGWLRDAAVRTRFATEVRHCDGVHIHGLWDVTSAAASRAALQWHKPYVLSCHGMLEPWALHHGKLKKRIYSALIERDVVRKARCLHALTQAEAIQCRDFGGTNTPAVVIPNGVSVPDELSPELFLSRYPELRGRRIVLFLARLHVKKGIDLLVRAWGDVVAKAPDAVLVVAGPDADGFGAALQEDAASRGVQDSIAFTGMLSGENKWSAIAAAECMVLPSHSEGLSMSVLEAMGAGVPVLVTPQCNMPWVPQIGAGWLMEPATGAISDALIEILSRGKQANAATGAVGREFIRQNYSWSSVAERIAEVYRWCLGDNEPTLSEVVR